MSEDTRNIIVGVATLAVLFLLGSATFGGISWGAGGYTVNAGFNRIDGLTVGDEVRMSGIRIGEVAAMRLGERYNAKVDLRIETPISLPADTSAAIHTDGLFGSKHVVLVPGADDTMLRPGGTIELTQDSVVITELLDLIIAEAKANQARQRSDGAGDEGEAGGRQDRPGEGAPGSLMAPMLDGGPSDDGEPGGDEAK